MKMSEREVASPSHLCGADNSEEGHRLDEGVSEALANFSFRRSRDEDADIADNPGDDMTGGEDEDDCYLEHNVQFTDTLAGVALKYNVSVEALKKLNKLSSSSIMCYDKLKVPIHKVQS